MNRLSGIHGVFLDMDDTIYRGNTLFPCTKPFLAFLKARGIHATFLSNNSSYSIGEYVEKLQRMGIAAESGNFYTSVDHTVDFLKKNHPSFRRIYLLGMRSIVPQFEQAGFEVVEESPDAVVIAFDRSLAYERLCRACWFLKQGVPGFATHPDVFCPTDQPTFLVDCGAITACIEAATGVKLKVLGKPDPGILIGAAARLGLKPEECLMVGDRLATDIAVGVNAGALTCHIAGNPEGTFPPVPKPDFRVKDLSFLQKIWESH